MRAKGKQFCCFNLFGILFKCFLSAIKTANFWSIALIPCNDNLKLFLFVFSYNIFCLLPTNGIRQPTILKMPYSLHTIPLEPIWSSAYCKTVHGSINFSYHMTILERAICMVNYCLHDRISFHRDDRFEPIRKAWRYQRGNQKPYLYIGEGQTIQLGKRKSTSNDLHRKEKNRSTRIPLKPGCELWCSGRVSSSCSTCDTCRMTLVTNPVISHETSLTIYILLKCAYQARRVIGHVYIYICVWVNQFHSITLCDLNPLSTFFIIKRWRKLKGQSGIDNPETQATLNTRHRTRTKPYPPSY